ncbi:hypothetical protein HDU98_002057 [Podochytrium sp. JEL0797]|nr:hypothetical protein HDU98_002057 [Podochytrium sp. JEL0797]
MHEVNLDSSKNASLAAACAKLTQPTRLSACNCALPSLDGAASPFVAQLLVADNRVAALPASLGASLPNLARLDLANNRLQDWDTLAVLKKCPLLKHLNLEENKLAKDKNYRARVLEMLPNLVSLDGIDRDGNDVDDDESGDEDESEGDEEDEYDEDDEADDGAEDDENADAEGEYGEAFNEDEDAENSEDELDGDQVSKRKLEQDDDDDLDTERYPVKKSQK